MEIYNDSDNDRYTAFANPCRWKIIGLLKWQGLSVSEISSFFDISQPSISRHLEILRNAKIVIGRRRGNQIIYSLNLTVMEEIRFELLDLFSTGGEAHEPV